MWNLTGSWPTTFFMVKLVTVCTLKTVLKTACLNSNSLCTNVNHPLSFSSLIAWSGIGVSLRKIHKWKINETIKKAYFNPVELNGFELWTRVYILRSQSSSSESRKHIFCNWLTPDWLHVPEKQTVSNYTHWSVLRWQGWSIDYQVEVWPKNNVRLLFSPQSARIF